MHHRAPRTLVALAMSVLMTVGLVASSAPAAKSAEPVLSSLVYNTDLALLGKSIVINPAAHTVAVNFSSKYKYRVVTLQTRVDATQPWTKLSTARKLSYYGKTTFKGIYFSQLSQYRVVVDKTSTKAAMQSNVVRPEDQWRQGFTEEFTGPELSAPWSDRMVGELTKNRWCSVPSANPIVRYVANGQFTTRVIRHDGDAFDADITAKAKALQKAAGKAQVGCPYGSFENGMVSTQAKGLKINTGKPGIIVVRGTFPMAQGMHGSVWLQSYVRGGAEIDFIESFGYRANIASVIHVPSTGYLYKPGNGKTTQIGGYVLKTATSYKSWWARPHEFSVEWTATKWIFRVDGKVSRTIYKTPGNADYFLIMSLLTSDWELKRLKSPVNYGIKAGDLSAGYNTPHKMSIDWIRVWARP